jgi:hypothetical protein
MADFNIRTDAVDVEQIMRQIRARIQDKRGIDYTEQQIQELANVKLERFLDPKGIRSDLVEQFKRDQKPEAFQPEQYTVDRNDLFGSARGFMRVIRKLLHPILKLFLNANRLVQVLHQQSEINVLYEKQLRQRAEMDVLYYELVHNLVLELTRVGIENRNVKMRLESLASRMDFDERRARALEGVVQYRPGTGPSRESVASPRPVVQTAAPAHSPQAVQGPSAESRAASGTGEPATDPGTARRRRRRRRGRRGGRGQATGESTPAGTAVEVPSVEQSATPPHGDPAGDAALEQESIGSDFGDDSTSDPGEDEGPEPSQQ